MNRTVRFSVMNCTGIKEIFACTDRGEKGLVITQKGKVTDIGSGEENFPETTTHISIHNNPSNPGTLIHLTLEGKNSADNINFECHAYVRDSKVRLLYPAFHAIIGNLDVSDMFDHTRLKNSEERIDLIGYDPRHAQMTITVMVCQKKQICPPVFGFCMREYEFSHLKICLYYSFIDFPSTPMTIMKFAATSTVKSSLHPEATQTEQRSVVSWTRFNLEQKLKDVHRLFQSELPIYWAPGGSAFQNILAAGYTAGQSKFPHRNQEALRHFGQHAPAGNAKKLPPP